LSDNLNQYDAIRNEFELSTRWWNWTFDWTTEPKHDADGNTTYLPSATGFWDMEWNAENRLVAAESADTRVEFTYDYKGRRVQKKVYTIDPNTGETQLTTTSRFIYNGWNLIYTENTDHSLQLTKHSLGV